MKPKTTHIQWPGLRNGRKTNPLPRSGWIISLQNKTRRAWGRQEYGKRGVRVFTHILPTRRSLWFSARLPYFETVSRKLVWLAVRAANRLGEGGDGQSTVGTKEQSGRRKKQKQKVGGRITTKTVGQRWNWVWSVSGWADIESGWYWHASLWLAWSGVKYTKYANGTQVKRRHKKFRENTR